MYLLISTRFQRLLDMVPLCGANTRMRGRRIKNQEEPEDRKHHAQYACKYNNKRLVG